MQRSIRINISILFALFVSSGCTLIPQEAPELSSELGKRISAIEESHIGLLRLYIDEKRKKVDNFLMSEWVPKFAETLFDKPNISATWDQVVASGDKHDRLQFLTIVGPKLQERINEKRVKLIAPLYEIEKDIERKLRDEYRQARAINNSITSFLSSASKVAENRDRLLELVGIENEKIRKTITDADEAVNDLIESKKSVEERFSKYIESIEAIRDAFRRN